MEPVRNESQADELRRAELRRRILQQLRRAAPRFVLEGPEHEPAAEPVESPQPDVPVMRAGPVRAAHGAQREDAGRLQHTTGGPVEAESRGEVAGGDAAAAVPEHGGIGPAGVADDAVRVDARMANRRPGPRRVRQNAKPAQPSVTEADALDAGQDGVEHVLRVGADERRRDSGGQDDPAIPQAAADGVMGFDPAVDEELPVDGLASPEVLRRVLLFSLLGGDGADGARLVLGLRLRGVGSMVVDICRTGPRRVRLRLRASGAVRRAVEGQVAGLCAALVARRLVVEGIEFDG